MKCEYCDNEVPAGSTRCPSCGATVKAGPVPQAPIPQVPAAQAVPVAPVAGGYVAVQPAVNVVLNVPPKSRTIYVVLAIFLGELGIHNFYAGYTGRGVAQLLISLIIGSFTCGVSSLVVWIWAIIEACVVTADAKGVPFN